MKISVCTPYYNTDCKLWFAESLARTRWPEGADVQFLKTCGMWTPNAFKMMVEKSLEIGADHIVIISVDVGWQPDDIKKLIAHNLPIVGGWAIGRMPPFVCHVADYMDAERRKLRPVTNPKERHGVEEICGNGSELVVYQSDVFRRIPPPWFFGIEMVDTDRMMSEDYFFALQAEKHGVKMYVDWDVPLIHAVDGLVSCNGDLQTR